MKTSSLEPEGCFRIAATEAVFRGFFCLIASPTTTVGKKCFAFGTLNGIATGFKM
jgi:hypothetical protein